LKQLPKKWSSCITVSKPCLIGALGRFVAGEKWSEVPRRGSIQMCLDGKRLRETILAGQSHSWCEGSGESTMACPIDGIGQAIRGGVSVDRIISSHARSMSVASFAVKGAVHDAGGTSLSQGFSCLEPLDPFDLLPVPLSATIRLSTSTIVFGALEKPCECPRRSTEIYCCLPCLLSTLLSA
jgi:hypothetical protein